MSVIRKRLALRQGLGQQERGHLLLLVTSIRLPRETHSAQDGCRMTSALFLFAFHCY